MPQHADEHNKEILKENILFFQQNFQPHWIERTLILPHNTNKIITIIGPRRVGKTHILLQHISTLLKNKIPLQHILYLNLEDERLHYESLQPDTILRAYTELYPTVPYHKIFLLLDEIQYLPKWEKFIRRVYDTYTKNIYLTGSNSAFLQYNISTSLRGRTLSYQVFPLSFREFLKFKNFTITEHLYYQPKKRSELLHLFEEYLEFGGFPEISLSPTELKVKILQEYIHVMLYKDMVEQFKISDVSTLKYLLKRLVINTARPLSIHKIYNELKSAGYKTSKDTLYQYEKLLEDVFAVFPLYKHYQSLTKTELAERKIYPVDNGYIQAFQFVHKEHYGIMLENLIRQFFQQKYSQIFFYKDKKEVDFLTFDEKEKPHLFQVCMNLFDEETRKREIQSLVSAAKEYKIKEAHILTWNEEETINVDKLKIHILPAHKYILENS